VRLWDVVTSFLMDLLSRKESRSDTEQSQNITHRAWTGQDSVILTTVFLPQTVVGKHCFTGGPFEMASAPLISTIFEIGKKKKKEKEKARMGLAESYQKKKLMVFVA
jgi:hypothetical protein